MCYPCNAIDMLIAMRFSLSNDLWQRRSRDFVETCVSVHYDVRCRKRLVRQCRAPGRTGTV